MTNVQNQTPTGRWHEWTRGDRLRVARETIADSQAEFAKLALISKNTVSRYENDGAPRQIVVEQWARITGFDYDWLMWGKVPDHRPDPAGGQPVDPSSWTASHPGRGRIPAVIPMRRAS